MTSQGKLREKWPWHVEFLRVFVVVPTVTGVAIAAVLFPVYGPHSLWFLLAIPFGLLFRLIFGVMGAVVRAKVAALRDSMTTHDGEAVESLLVIGHIHSPGLAILGESELVLVPIVGDTCTIPLADITAVRQGRWLPGKYVWGKWAFNLTTPRATRLAFAVPESVGKRWSARLKRL